MTNQPERRPTVHVEVKAHARGTVTKPDGTVREPQQPDTAITVKDDHG